MESIQLHSLLHENTDIRLKVFLACSTKRAGDLAVKQYLCKSDEEGDFLLKEAIRQTRDAFPLWAVLIEVLLDKQGRHFTVNFVYQKLVTELPSTIVETNDRARTSSPGLSAYMLGLKLFQKPNNGPCVYEAIQLSPPLPVIVKASGQITNVTFANRILAEAIVQAHVAHRHTTPILEVAFGTVEGARRLCLVMERLSRDVQQDIELRKTNKQPYTERELLEFVKQVTAGLVQAKKKVRNTQKIAHRDIKPANIFIAEDGTYKVGDFGSAWRKSKEKSETHIAGVSEMDRVLESLTNSGGGTIPYLSPEMRASLMGLDVKVDSFASDVYSLGITVLQLAKLELPESLTTTIREECLQHIEAELAAITYSEFCTQTLRAMLRWESGKRPIVEELTILVRTQLGEDNQRCVEDDARNMTSEQLAVEESRLKAEVNEMEACGTENAELAATHSALSCVYRAQNRRRQAVAHSHKALSICTQLFSENHPATATIWDELSSLWKDMGRLPEALDCASKSLSIRLATLGENSAATATSYNNLALVYKDMGRLSEAADSTLKSLRISTRIHGENHSSTATTYSNLATVYQDMGRLSDAAESLNRSLRIKTAALGERHPSVAISLNNLAQLWKAMGRYPQATECTMQALSIFIETYGENHPSTAVCFNNAACISKETGRLSEAIAYTHKSLSISLQIFGENHPSIACVFNTLAQTYKAMGLLPEAAEYTRKSLRIIQAAFGENHLDAASCYNNLANVCIAMGKLDEAAKHANKALSIRLEALGEIHALTAISYSNLASICQAMGRTTQAEKYSKESLSIAIQVHGENHPTTATFYSNLACIYKETGRLQEAAENAHESLSIRLIAFGENHPDTAVSYVNLAIIYCKMRDLLNAHQFAQQSVGIFTKVLGPTHPSTSIAVKALAGIEMELATQVHRESPVLI